MLVIVGGRNTISFNLLYNLPTSYKKKLMKLVVLGNKPVSRSNFMRHKTMYSTRDAQQKEMGCLDSEKPFSPLTPKCLCQSQYALWEL